MMATKVVNLRRARYQVYIGRGKGGQVPDRPGEYGWLGNPVAIGKTCPRCGHVHADAGSTLPCYREYLKERLQDPEWQAAFFRLKGKVLGCFCKPGACHGDVIVEVLESQEV